MRQEPGGVHREARRHESAVELHALQRPVERRQPVAREARHAPMDGEPILAGAPLGSAVAHAAQPDAAHVLPSLEACPRLGWRGRSPALSPIPSTAVPC